MSDHKFSLTSQEMRVFERLMAGPESYQEIGSYLGLSEACVKSHAGTVLKKMGVKSRLQLVFQELVWKKKN